MDAPTAVVLAACLSLLSAVAAALITARVAGRANKTNAMLEWAKQLQSSERDARQDAAQEKVRADRIRDETDAEVESFRQRFTELEDKLRSATALADRLADTLASVQVEVWRPEPDVTALRRLVGRPPTGLNGR